MRPILSSSKGALSAAVLLLRAFATQDYASRMSEPNFGLRVIVPGDTLTPVVGISDEAVMDANTHELKRNAMLMELAKSGAATK